MHAANKTEIVGDATDCREHFAHLDAGFAIFLEGLDRWLAGPLGVATRHCREPRRAPHTLRDVFASPLADHRLGVVEIDMRRTTSLPEHHHPLGFRLVVGQLWEARHGRSRCRRDRSGRVTAQQRCQRE